MGRLLALKGGSSAGLTISHSTTPNAHASAGLAGGVLGGWAESGPPIDLLPEIRRCAVLSFHRDSPEAVGERSALVEMLLKYAKEANGCFKCPLVQSASELGLDAHAAHHELAQLHEAGEIKLELLEPAFYFRIRRVP